MSGDQKTLYDHDTFMEAYEGFSKGNQVRVKTRGGIDEPGLIVRPEGIARVLDMNSYKVPGTDTEMDPETGREVPVLEDVDELRALWIDGERATERHYVSNTPAGARALEDLEVVVNQEPEKPHPELRFSSGQF